ncbi:carbohydrate ABC transporter permease [Kribbella sp. GL6]|uniref:carbohydrate ABC transporter permease n=1 Tax=Kribbella sp. GL6 TaxID=3419765 RepID=UPI003D070EBB
MTHDKLTVLAVRHQTLGRTSAEPRTPLALAAIGRRFRGTLVVAVVVLLIGFPLLWMTLSAFKSTGDIVKDSYPLSWRTFVPAPFTLHNFANLFGSLGFGRNLLNTVIASAGQILGAMVVSTLAGYGFARVRSRLGTAVFGLCMLGAFIPVEAVIVPLYKTVQGLGLLSTYPVLFLPFVANPFGIFLMRQSFRDIPEELYDAAAVDGAGPARTFLRLAVPNVKPALATLALVQFIWSWSNYFWPLVANQDPNKQVAQVAMASLQTAANYQPMYGEMFAAATVITVPVVALSVVMQRYYIQGLLSSGLK